MTRYIDGDHLRAWILSRWEMYDPYSAYPLKAIDILDQIEREMKYPLVDVMPVVRCKDCRFNYGIANGEEFNADDILCTYFETDGMTANDYCSQAERKEK